MRLEVNGKMYIVRFFHDTKNKRKKTFCSISLLEEPKSNIATGETQVNKCDDYSKVVGRKMAFGRALQDLTEDKEERILFWKALSEQCKIIQSKKLSEQDLRIAEPVGEVAA